jgi:hypothetical protein
MKPETQETQETQDPLKTAMKAFAAVAQYQRDWQKHGIARVYLYFDEVEGDWLEEWEDGDRPRSE